MFIVKSILVAALLLAGVCITPTTADAFTIPLAADAVAHANVLDLMLATAAVVPAASKWLCYADLEVMGIAPNRTTLGRMIDEHGFPEGVLITPNRRIWRQSDVEQWLEGRPTERKAISPFARKSVKPKVATATKPITSARRSRQRADDRATARESA